MTRLHGAEAQFVLPADLYDTLELAAEWAGGVGVFLMYQDTEREVPHCIHGLLEFARGQNNWRAQESLNALGLTPAVHDELLLRRFPRLRRHWQARVTFREWCQALGVARNSVSLV